MTIKLIDFDRMLTRGIAQHIPSLPEQNCPHLTHCLFDRYSVLFSAVFTVTNFSLERTQYSSPNYWEDTKLVNFFPRKIETDKRFPNLGNYDITNILACPIKKFKKILCCIPNHFLPSAHGMSPEPLHIGPILI